jgi:hypothetical protein
MGIMLRLLLQSLDLIGTPRRSAVARRSRGSLVSLEMAAGDGG